MPPTEETPTVNSVWATAIPINTTELITLPSGQTCYARRLGLEGIMTAGLLGDADSLTAFVGTKHIRRVRGANKKPDGEEVDGRSVMQDPEALKRIVFLVDRATPMIVSDPVVHTHFRYLDDGTTQMIPQEEREPGQIYTDMIQLQDKMFLFNFAIGGTRDLERFRNESASAVEDVPDGQDVPRAPQPGTPHGGGGRRRRPPRRG
jgi:hypothetical protein